MSHSEKNTVAGLVRAAAHECLAGSWERHPRLLRQAI